MKPVNFIVDILLVKHLSDHYRQIRRDLEQYGSSWDEAPAT
jgi:hypothetical protein